MAVRERAGRERRTVGAVLSDLARQALLNRFEGHEQAGCSESADAFHGFDPLPHRGAAVSNALIDRLRDEESV